MTILKIISMPTLIDAPNQIQAESEESNVISLESIKNKLFSFFRKPVTNVYPSQSLSVLQAYNKITGPDYAYQTRVLRLQPDKIAARRYKASAFDYSCFSGTFTTRGDKNLIEHSGFMILDFDHIQDVTELKDELISNLDFETVLAFISPSGDGLKWLVKIDLSLEDHKNWFLAIANYIKTTYQLEVDKSGKDVSRCCFLPFDPDCYINEKYI
jgi:hypothetical protein